MWSSEIPLDSWGTLSTLERSNCTINPWEYAFNSSASGYVQSANLSQRRVITETLNGSWPICAIRAPFITVQVLAGPGRWAIHKSNMPRTRALSSLSRDNLKNSGNIYSRKGGEKRILHAQLPGFFPTSASNRPGPDSGVWQVEPAQLVITRNWFEGRFAARAVIYVRFIIGVWAYLFRFITMLPLMPEPFLLWTGPQKYCRFCGSVCRYNARATSGEQEQKRSFAVKEFTVLKMR